MDYYNEIDPKAAAWLRELMKQGHIPQGEVDERSIADVRGSDLSGFTRCHFFAGVAGWAVALALAGWPANQPVWTGSCPCQPFSVAGKKKGHADKRHLWPEFRRLIAECHPATVFGEQVASKYGRDWLSGVRTDLEGLAYAFGAADLCAAGAGAPHIRQRLWWVADAGGRRCEQCDQSIGELSESDTGSSAGRLAESDGREPWHSGIQRGEEYRQLAENGGIVGMGHSNQPGPQRRRQHPGEHAGELFAGQAGSSGGLGDANRAERRAGSGSCGDEGRDRVLQGQENADGSRGANETAGGLADAEHHGGWPDQQERCPQGRTSDGGAGKPGFRLGDTTGGGCGVSGDEALKGSCGYALSASWSAFDLIHCTDGKTRRIESGTFPLAYGSPARVGRLRGYGNAIVPQVAAIFIRASMEAAA